MYQPNVLSVSVQVSVQSIDLSRGSKELSRSLAYSNHIMEENNQPSSKDNFQVSPCFKDSLVEQSTLKH